MDSTIRMENLNRRGTRLFSHERLRRLLYDLRPPLLTPRQYNLVEPLVRAVLAEANVAVQDELYTGRRFRAIKQALEEAEW